MSWIRFCKTSWRRLENVLKMSWKRLEDVLKTSWRRLGKVLKTSWRRIARTNILVLTKTSWRRLEDVFWRRMINKNILVFIKTSWRRLKDVFRRRRRKTSSSRRMFAGFSFHPVNVILLVRSWFCLSKNIITSLVWGMRFFAMVRFQSLNEVSK